MADDDDWDIPVEAQPGARDYRYDLDVTLDAVVALSARIPADAHTAQSLGTERSGNAVVIAPDQLLTIGYLIVEASEIWLRTNKGKAVPAHVVGYDYATGFGLIEAQEPLNCPALALGDSEAARPGDAVVVAGAGGRRGALAAHVVARQQFAGYWEYVLDNAIFTSPAHPNWGGAALIGPSGELWGIGSLQVPHQLAHDEIAILNMIVPTQALLPILPSLRAIGRADSQNRPWLGLFAAEAPGAGIIIIGLAGNGPANRAGLREGDLVLAVGGREVHRLADFFKAIWELGEPGVDVPLKIDREGDVFDVVIKSADRYRFLKREPLH